MSFLPCILFPPLFFGKLLFINRPLCFVFAGKGRGIKNISACFSAACTFSIHVARPMRKAISCIANQFSFAAVLISALGLYAVGSGLFHRNQFVNRKVFLNQRFGAAGLGFSSEGDPLHRQRSGTTRFRNSYIASKPLIGRDMFSAGTRGFDRESGCRTVATIYITLSGNINFQDSHVVKLIKTSMSEP